ncbi:MAG: hypothetical protein DRP22_03810 [Verrucomicrobia bacterium]|nr:MAG: hypothetical protein DRP22_03810 [Verrucomicrobiota bacterium]
MKRGIEADNMKVEGLEVLKRVTYIESPSPAAVGEALNSWPDLSREVILVLVAETSVPVLGEVIGRLKGSRARFVGAVVPGLICNGEVHLQGILMLRLRSAISPLLIRLDDRDEGYPADILRLNEALAESGGTLLILVDGLNGRISSFLREISGLLGNHVAYLGGGAGYTDLVQRPCIFSAAGVFSDAAVVVPLPCRAKVGMRHGFERVGPLLVATRTNNDRVYEIDWRNAFEVYRDVVSKTCAAEVDQQNFSAMAPYHPLGIIRERAEELIQDPVAAFPDGSLKCLGRIPENSPMSIMNGNPEAMIRAARDAGRVLREASRAAAEGEKCRPDIGIIIDCVSRFLLLGDRFGEELSAVLHNGNEGTLKIPIAGFLSIGEIGCSGEGWVDFHNKTVVTGVLYE